MVLDLDANDDGNMVDMEGRSVAEMFADFASFGSTVMDAANDVRYGVNGVIELGYSKGGINLTIPAASATLIYAPGQIAFRGASDNPFEGTALEAIAPQNFAFDVKGNLSWGTSLSDLHWSFTVTSFNESIADVANSRFSVTFDDTGIRGSTIQSWDLYIAKANIASTFELKVTSQGVGLAVGMSAYIQLGWDSFNVHASLGVAMTVSVGWDGGFNFSGTASLRGGVKLGFISKDVDILNIGVDNNGFRIDVPLLKNDIVVKW